MAERLQSYVYILTNVNRTTFDIGVTADLQRRVWQHRNGEHIGFARRYNLMRLVWFETFRDIENAIAREKQIRSKVGRGRRSWSSCDR